MAPDSLPDLTPFTGYDERLCQVPLDRPAIEAAIALATERLRQATARGDQQARLRLLGYLGDALRVLGRDEEAGERLDAAATLAAVLGDARAEVANPIRQGELERSRDNPARDAVLLRAALGRIEGAPELRVYHDFALRHLGKCLLEMSETGAAIGCLEQALRLREAKEDPALMRSTLVALQLARRQQGARQKTNR